MYMECKPIKLSSFLRLICSEMENAYKMAGMIGSRLKQSYGLK